MIAYSGKITVYEEITHDLEIVDVSTFHKNE